MKLRLIILLLLPLQLLSQDITGLWTGTLQTPTEKLKYEIVISQQNNKYSGYALTAFNFEGKENIGIKTIEVKIKSGRILIEDEELVYNNYSTPPKRVKLFGDLWLGGTGPALKMRGEFHTRTLDFRASDKTSYKGSIFLQKEAHTSPALLIAKLNELNLLASLSFMQPKKNDEKKIAATENPNPSDNRNSTALVKANDRSGAANKTLTDEKEKKGKETSIDKPALSVVSKPAAALALRKTEVIRTISFSSDSLLLTLYDNGEIDGDTVSVVLNGKVIIANKALTANALQTTIKITPDMGDSLQLVLYAENLGSIAPNTGLLVLNDGKEKHEIRFAGDLQKSSAIMLTRRR